MSLAEVLPSPQKLTSQQLRKIKKPIIERRRRERINESLNQLKSLVLDALHKDESQYNKMEKADILEMTVKHLKNLQHRLSAAKASSNAPPAAPSQHPAPISCSTVTTVDRYKTGFKECTQEVSRYLNSIPAVHPQMKEHLDLHLNKCATGIDGQEKTLLRQQEPATAVDNQARSTSNMSPLQQHHNHHQQQSHLLNGIQVGVPVMSGGVGVLGGGQPQVMLAPAAAMGGSLSPAHAHSFVPVLISPGNGVSIVSPSNISNSDIIAHQQNSQNLQAQQAQHVSPLSGSVIPLYSSFSSGSPSPSMKNQHKEGYHSPLLVSPDRDAIQNINVNNGLYVAKSPSSKCSSPSFQEVPSSPKMGDNTRHVYSIYPEDSSCYKPSKALSFDGDKVSRNIAMKYVEHDNAVTRHSGSVKEAVTRHSGSVKEAITSAHLLNHKLNPMWGEYTQDLHKYRSDYIQRPNSPVWRPW